MTGTVALVPGGYRLLNVDEATPQAGSTGGRGPRDHHGRGHIRSLTDGRVLATASNYNRQISCGEDILPGELRPEERSLPAAATCGGEHQ